MMRTVPLFFAVVVSLTLGTTTNAADIELRILINGVDAEQHILAPGQHTLRVEGIVTDNEIPGAGPGGLLQSSFSLIKDSDAVTFVEGIGFLGGPSGEWDSAANSAFLLNNPGAFDPSGNVIHETNAILQSQWNMRFDSAGADEFSLIAEGPFTWDGSSQCTRIELQSGVDVNLRAVSGNGSIAAAQVDGVVRGDSVYIGPCPEPGTAILASLVLLGAVVMRRGVV